MISTTKEEKAGQYPRMGNRKESFLLCIDSPFVAWEWQIGLSFGTQKTLGNATSFWRSPMTFKGDNSCLKPG